ncbi:MAG: hypothetical protein LBV72_19335 [Tannerella sp.]|jgi:hypothetical protein|nr:hypothetical protein [Tannerella sp.]
MKKIFVLLLSVMVLFSCVNESPRDKAIVIIEKYYKDRKIDLSDFSNIEYSSLDSAFNSFYDIPGYREISTRLIRIGGQLDKENYLIEYEDLTKQRKELESKFVKQFKGFKIYQIYTHATPMGYSAEINVFLIDPQITTLKVVKESSSYEDIPIEVYNAVLRNGVFFSDSINADLNRFDEAYYKFKYE